MNEGWIDKFEWPTMPRGVNRRKSTRVLRQEKRSTLRSLPNREQVFALLDALENHQPESRRYRAMTAVGVFAGLRPSEVVVLRVADFAYATDGTASIHVERAWSGSDPMWGNVFDDVGATKTGVGREVLIPACLCDEIMRWQRYSGIAAGPLFLECGYPPRNWRRALRAACDAIGIATLTPYGLRHTNATWRLAVGAPLGVVADQLGHTVQSLVNHYVGVMQGSEHTALAKFEEFLRAS